MGDFFSSLASQRSALTTFFTLVLFCALLFITWPARRYPYRINRDSRIHAYWLILLYFVFAMNDGDWFHLYNLFQDSSFRSRDVSDISSQSAGLEQAYIFIAKIVGYNYLLFRLIVWGGTALFSYLLGKRLGVNKSLYLFFFVIISLDIFSFQRGSLAMALGFWGFSYIIKPFKKSKLLSFCIGLTIIYCSTFFHKSAFILIPVFLLSFLRYNKRTIVLLLIGAPVIAYFMLNYLADFLLNLGTDGELINATVMQGYLTVEKRHMGIGSILRNIILPLMFFSMFWYVVKQVIIKKVPLPNPYLRLFNSAFVIIVGSFLLLIVGSVINVSMLYMRFLYFSVLPLSIVISYIYDNYKKVGKPDLFVLICITCSLYKIILNLLGAIFLGEAGRT